MVRRGSKKSSRDSNALVPLELQNETLTKSDACNKNIYEKMETMIPAQVKQIRSVMEAEHNLIIPDDYDAFIARCLRMKDGNLESAIKLVRGFHTSIVNFQNWDVELMPSLYKEDCKSGVVLSMKNLDKCGRRMVIMRTGLWDHQKVGFDQVVAMLWMIAQYTHSEQIDVQREGFTLIWDFSEFTWQHAWAVKHLRLLTLMKWAQNGVSGRMKALHAIHHSKAVDYLYKAIKPFMKEKLKKRIILHDCIESLHNHVGQENLPNFLEGPLDPEKCVNVELMNGFFKSDQYFQDMMEVGFPSK